MIGKWMEEVKGANVPARYRQRVAERLAILEYARASSSATAGLRFGLCEKTLRRCRKRRQAEGICGLIPRYPA